MSNKRHLDYFIEINEREMLIPGSLRNIAVQNDTNSEKTKIVLPRYFDGADLSQYSIMMKAVSKGGKSDYLFTKEEINVLEDKIELMWTLKVPMTSYSGTVKIQLCIFGKDFKWQTEPTEINISKSLDGEPIIPEQLDMLEHFITEIQDNIILIENFVDSAEQNAEKIKQYAEQIKNNSDEIVQNIEVVKGIKEEVDAYKTHIEDIKQQIDVIQSEVNETNSNFQQLADTKKQEIISEATKQLSEIKKQGETLLNNVKEQVKIATQQATIATEKAKIATDKADIATQKAQTATEQANIATNKAGVATEQATIATNKAEEATEQVEIAKSEIAKVNEKLQTVESKNQEQDERLTQLENEPTSNVLLKEEEQDKFNFVENEVIQDGLIYAIGFKGGKHIKPGDLQKINVTEQKQVYMYIRCMIGKSASSNTSYIIHVPNTANETGYFCIDKRFDKVFGNFQSTENTTSYSATLENPFDKPMDCMFTWDNETLKPTKQIVNGVELEIDSRVKTQGKLKSIELLKNTDCTNILYSAFIYNRPLSPQEIEHNLSVLNNTDSIKSLEVTKGDTTTSYNFATDENHVEMSTGRTLHDEYMSVLKTMGKEFESSDGSDITVENGLEARVISGEITGRTINNILKSFSKLSPQDDTINGKYSTPLHQPTNDKITIMAKITNIDTSSGDLLSPAFLVNTGAENKAIYFDGGSDIKAKIKDGVFTNTISLGENAQHMNDTVRVYKPPVSTANCRIEWLVVLDGDCKFGKGNMPYGLNSTQAIIENNGKEYKIYEPTIQGKTKILKANKGTQEWVEIDNSEERDLTRYDYKLEGLNNNIFSTLEQCDEIDIAKKKIMRRVKKIILNGSESWIKEDESTESTIAFKLNILDRERNVLSMLCDKIPVREIFSQDKEGIRGYTDNDSIMLRILKSKLSSLDAQGLKKYLSNNPFTLLYVTKEVISEQLTDEQFKQYESYKKVILLPFAEDKLTLNEDGSVAFIKSSNGVVFDGSEEWVLMETRENTLRFNFPAKEYGMALNQLAILDKLPFNNPSSGDNEGFRCLNNTFTIAISKTKLNTQDIQGFKKWLSENKPIGIYPLATSTTTQIPKELIPPIKTHLTNKISVGGTVKPSSYKLTLPVNKLSDFEKRLQALESATVDVILNK